MYVTQWHLKSPRNFRPHPWILPKIFIFYTVLTYTFDIPFSKQKHTTGSLTHTHTHTHTTSNNYKQKATGHVTSLANDHLTGSDAPFVCEIPTTSSYNLKKKKSDNFANIGVACFKLSRWFGKRHKTDAFTKLGNLLSELHSA